MKKFVLVIIIVCSLVVLFAIPGCGIMNMFYSRSVVKIFNERYDSKSLESFCEDMPVYKMEVMIPGEAKSVLVLLESNESAVWTGILSLRSFSDNRYTTIESYQIEVVGEYLQIYNETNKKIPLDSLFFCQFDLSEYKIAHAYEDVDEPRHVVDGEYNNEVMKQHMIRFYDEFISCLKEFELKDLYFSALDHLYANEYRDNIGTSRSFSFAFDEGQTDSDLPFCIYPKAKLVFMESCDKN